MSEYAQLEEMAKSLVRVCNELGLREAIDLQDDPVQLCAGDMIVVADAKSNTFDVIVPLDENRDKVAVLCFPEAFFVVRYIVAKFLA